MLHRLIIPGPSRVASEEVCAIADIFCSVGIRVVDVPTFKAQKLGSFAVIFFLVSAIIAGLASSSRPDLFKNSACHFRF
jgi:hypothetical protein